jgi:hypothetical protein
MPDRETWRFINTFAPWFSALGTLTAVIVSLYLARRAAKLDVRVNLSVVSLFSQGQNLSGVPPYFNITVVNHGREAVIKGIGWRQRWPTRHVWSQIPPNDPLSTKLPARLEFGDTATLLFPTTTFNADAKPILEHVKLSRFPKLTVRLLRAGVYASTGEEFLVRFDKHIRRFILERAAQI